MVERQRLANETLRALALALDTDEALKLHHAWRVAVLAHRLSTDSGLGDPSEVFHAGLLHDIGGIGMGDHVLHLFRRGTLTAELVEHPAKGRRIVEPVSVLRSLAPIIETHHEHYDGSGFPAGMKGDRIPVEAQLVLMADLVDVNLRGREEDEWARYAGIIAERQRGRWVHPDVANALLGLLETDTEFLSRCFDVAWLEEEVGRISPPLSGVQDSTREEMLVQLLWLFARVVDAKHAYTAGHSTRVAYYAYKIGQTLGPSEVEPLDMLWAGLLHDVGKVATPRRILDKDGPLDEREWSVIREHPVHTETIISTISELRHLARAAAGHHEHYDGSGYPRGQVGDAIPLLSRVLAYADVYDAVTSGRPYRSRGSHADGVETVRKAAGRLLDPHLLDVAVATLDRHGVGRSKTGPSTGFDRLLDDGIVQLSDVFAEEVGTSHRVRTIGQRVLVAQAEQWSSVRLDRDMKVIPGGEQVSRLLGGMGSGTVLDAFERADAEEIRVQIAGLGEGDVFTQYYETRAKEPVELVVQRDGQGFGLLCRSAKGKFQTVQRLAMFSRSFTASSDASLFLDVDARIVDANQTFLARFGMRRDEVVGADAGALRKPWGTPLSEIVARLRVEDDPVVGPMEITDGYGEETERVALLSVAPVHDAMGSLVGAVARFVDITERRRAERQLALRNTELAERNEELRRRNDELERLHRLKSDLMAITSHDMNSPLAAVVGVARMVRDEIEALPPQRVARAMDRLIDGSMRLRRLIHDVLDLERIEAGVLKLTRRVVFLESLLQDVVAGQDLGEKGVVVVPRLARGVVVLADASRLEQVFGNLLSNAVRFSPKGGTIEVELVGTDEGTARVRVADRGPGIPPADLEQIFDRYFQVERRHAVPTRGFGAGLGLSIVREIVGLHGGSVRAENRPGGGCCFVVDLPSLRLQDRPLRALIVDPAASVSGMLEDVLRLRAVDALVVEDADMGRRAIRLERPHLVFVAGEGAGQAAMRLGQVAGSLGYAPVLVAVCAEGQRLSGEVIRLDEPVLDVEVLEIVEAVRLREGGKA